MDNRNEVKGRLLSPSEITGILIPIHGHDKYFWDPDGDRLISYKRSDGPYQLKRSKLYDPRSHAYRNDSCYTLSCGPGNGSQLILLSELRKLKHEVKKEEKMNQYIIGSKLKNGGLFNMSQYPKVHDTEASARNEAERLARMEPTKRFLVLEIKGTVAMADIVWE